MKTIRYIVHSAVILLGLMIFTLSASGKTAPTVNNVRIEDDQRGHLVVFYDLKGEVDVKYSVTLAFSKDGKTYDIKPKAIAGDVGKGITPGARRKVIWDVKADIPEGLADGSYSCSVQAHKPGKVWPWLVGGGAVIAGGAAAVLLQPEEDKPTTGTIIIQTPDHP